MKKVYPAIFHTDDDGIWVDFPDLEGCHTYGSTLEECMSNAQEVLGLFIATLIEEKLPLPDASDIASITVPDGGFASYVYTDIDTYFRNNRAVKKTLSIPGWLSDAAEENHLSLSKVLQDGLKEALGY